jgi:hypothetical protein
MVQRSIGFAAEDRGKANQLPKQLPEIRLHHGRAVWVLSEAGFRGTATMSTFNYYVKSLRKLGVPFAHGAAPERTGRLVDYTYENLMELAVVLTLRVYNAVPDTLLGEVGKFRRELNRAYVQAYLHRRSGLGAPIRARLGRRILTLKGVFLDLQIEFAGGQLTGFGPPKLLSPFEAIATFAEGEQPARSHHPIHLSALSERVMQFALVASKWRDHAD